MRKRLITREENLALSWTLKEIQIFHWRFSAGKEVHSRQSLLLEQRPIAARMSGTFGIL